MSSAYPAIFRYGYVKANAALGMVGSMPVDDTAKRDLRARIRRWVRQLQERGAMPEE